MPTRNNTSGTKNRNRRKATAALTTVPADSRIAVVDPYSDVDERAVLVPLVGLPRLVSAHGDPLLSTLDQPPPEGGLAISRRVLW